MARSSLRTAALVIAFSGAAAPAVGAQSFGIAAGPAVERGVPTGGLVQLSYFTATAFARIGLRFDGLYTAQPGPIIEGTTQAGEHSAFQAPASHVYGLLGAVSYEVGRGAVRPYAIFGTGFYGRNAYTAGFTLGTNAGIGADVHVRGLQFFAEGRLHVFRGASNVRWTTAEQVRLMPVTIGLRF